MDHVAESNINRQVHANGETVGMAKVLAMKDRIASINPACEVLCVDDFVDPDNWPQILPSGVDAVIDACDKVKSKTAMAQWSRGTDAWFISAGAAGGKRHAHLADIADLAEVTHDPLLSQVRYNLRKFHGAPKGGKKMGVACVFSMETVRLPDQACGVLQSDSTLNCHGYGSLVTVTASFGLCAAGWVMDKISSVGLEGKKTI
jgi:tRNA A37 threonylcarbamoyladenosine dehydratase